MHIDKILIVVASLLLFNGCQYATQPAPKAPKVSETNTTQKDPKIKTPDLSSRKFEAPTPEKAAVFKKEMIKVALSTRKDPNYKRLALDTDEKKAWFKTLLYRLWDRQITRNEFIEEGLKRYPDRRYEFTFIANGLQRGCDDA